jgi:hypothetical protein
MSGTNNAAKIKIKIKLLVINTNKPCGDNGSLVLGPGC